MNNIDFWTILHWSHGVEFGAAFNHEEHSYSVRQDLLAAVVVLHNVLGLLVSV